MINQRHRLHITNCRGIESMNISMKDMMYCFLSVSLFCEAHHCYPSNLLVVSQSVSCPVSLFMCRYCELLIVDDIHSLIPVPGGMSMELAATLPTGGLWAYNTVTTIQTLLRQRYTENNGKYAKL